MPKVNYCKVCKREYKKYRSTQGVCSPKCAIIKVANDKAKKEVRRINAQVKFDKMMTAKERREFKLRDIPHQKELTQKSFNRLRVLEELVWFSDRKLATTCISCGKELGGDQWSCGHFKTVGAQSGLRYDKLNTWIQHKTRCNKELSGDIEGTKTTHGYKKGLIYRFGEEEGQRIIDYCSVNTHIVEWDGEELYKKRTEYNKEIRRIEKKLGLSA